jgi:hypothetical protein
VQGRLGLPGVQAPEPGKLVSIGQRIDPCGSERMFLLEMN